MSLAYREKMATMQELLRLREEGKLNKTQMQWFRNSKPVEELFDVKNDPHELNNLASDPAYANKLKTLRKECDDWMAAIDDKGFTPETELIEQFWPNKIQPVTSSPSIKKENGKIVLTCDTEGATIGYKFPEDDTPGVGWRIYKEPFDVSNGKSLKVISHRIGYQPSDTVLIEYQDLILSFKE